MKETKTKTTNEILNDLDKYLNIRIKTMNECLDCYENAHVEKDQYYYEELAVICEFYHLKEMIVNDDYMDKMIDIWSK